jgi:hypothetical protein
MLYVEVAVELHTEGAAVVVAVLDMPYLESSGLKATWLSSLMRTFGLHLFSQQAVAEVADLSASS